MRIAFLAACLSLLASAARGQRMVHPSTATVDLTGGQHTISGGLVDGTTGAMLDLLIAGSAESASRSAFVFGAGASGIVTGFGDNCLIRPQGGCAPKGNFVAFNVLAGVDYSLGGPSVRALIGPAVYDGAGARSLGVQARVDLMSAAAFHTGLGVMLRTTMLPSHGGQRLVATAVGLSLIGR